MYRKYFIHKELKHSVKFSKLLINVDEDAYLLYKVNGICFTKANYLFKILIVYKKHKKLFHLLQVAFIKLKIKLKY